jgi:hypothetical protein
VSGHLVHRLVRVLACDPATPESLIEAIGCAECDLLVLRPDEMPDYSQVDRLWRLR